MPDPGLLRQSRSGPVEENIVVRQTGRTLKIHTNARTVTARLTPKAKPAWIRTMGAVI
jgi:hypothetical protein